jgi:PAS domain S-box-containing protein
MKEKETFANLPSAPPKASYRILVVDDERAIRELHLEVLTGAGYEVMAVVDGALAWDALQTQHFDLMITDNSMPKVTGVELINKLITANIKLPVIMATGALPEHEFKRSPWLRDTTVLVKPVTNSAILSMVEKVLNEGKNIPNNRIDPKELAATKIKGNEERRIEKAEERLDRAEERSDQADARFDEAVARSDRAEARSEAAEILKIDALRSSEIRYRRLFEAARDGILILTLENGRITDVNPYLIEILGFSKSEMVGKTVGELSPFKDIEPNQVMLNRLKRDGFVRYENLPLENKDGRHIAVEFVCNVYQEDTTKVIQCNIRDITERKHAQDRKDQFSSELEKRVLERTAELEAFSGAVSHDLRAPLRHLASYLGELQDQVADQTVYKNNLELLTKCCQATKRMGNLIEDLLAFSRVGTASIKKKAVNLDDLIQETLDDYSPEIKDRQIEWNIQQMGVAKADPALLRLVFGNLISNAVKFTGGRTNPKIEIGCIRDSTNETVFFVRDNGAGFDPEYTEKLFGLFQRLHSQEEFEGTGLGLANMQRIILRHGGRVWAEGAVNLGATFYFSLPK